MAAGSSVKWVRDGAAAALLLPAAGSSIAPAPQHGQFSGTIPIVFLKRPLLGISNDDAPKLGVLSLSFLSRKQHTSQRNVPGK